MARTHEILNTEGRLEAALRMCDHLVEMLPVRMKIHQGGGGNWDDEEIFRFAERLGVRLKLNSKTVADVKRPLRENKGALQLIKHLRNKLAHGEMSFAECGEGLSASQLADLKDRTVRYLSEVLDCFEGFITRYEYLADSKRPPSGAQ